MTEEGADLLARLAGYRLVGVTLVSLETPHHEMPDHWLTAVEGRNVIIVEGGPWFALFVPEPDDRTKRVYIVAGQTKGRALRGGVMVVQSLSPRVHSRTEAA
jgi:hypothetical protein